VEFISTDEGQFVPSSESVAANKGDNDPEAYDIFYQRYGIDIKKDITGAPRIMDGVSEIGAYEITGDRTVVDSPPSAPVLSVKSE
jgi:hypothetical protein